MRIPPYYRIPTWQRFFSGIVVGIVIGWLFFVSLHGMAQENQIDKIAQLQWEKEKLIRDKNTLIEEKDKRNEELQKQLTIQNITIHIKNTTSRKLDSITKYELQNAVEEQIHSLLNKDIESVATNMPLIYRAIEEHTYNIENSSFQLKVDTLVLYTTLEVTVKIKE